FKISKEAIHNRIRRGSLDCVIEHGVKYIILDEAVQTKTSPTQALANDKLYAYIEDENKTLKDKIKDLEKRNTSLRDQKEQMLIQEKKNIEQVYKDRDAQLQQVLHTISAKFLPHIQEKNTVEKSKDDFVDVVELVVKPIRLKEFLKLKSYKSAKRQRIKNRFKRLIGRDERVFRRKGKVYVDPSRFDYKDLISE
ncbi:hypothetical protein JHD50_09905, partial [Sulfurimonas sp. MAG313]